MFQYTPQDITDILLVADHRITRITKTKAGHTENLSQNFAGISNIKLQNDLNPRSLQKAIEELESLFFEKQAISVLAFPVLKACEKSLDRIKISTAGLRRPAFLGKPPLVKTIAPNYQAFLGTDFKFKLYGEDVSHKISYDEQQLEVMVSEMVTESLFDLQKTNPALFKTSASQKFFQGTNIDKSFKDFDPN